MTQTLKHILENAASSLYSERGGSKPATLRSSDATWLLNSILDTFEISTLNRERISFTFRTSEPTIRILDDGFFVIGLPSHLFVGDKSLPTFIRYIALAMIDILTILLSPSRETWRSIELKRCITQKLIPELFEHISDEFVLINEKRGGSVKGYKGYDYESNSCYADSVLVPIFFGSNSYIRDLLLEGDVEHETWKNTDGATLKICPSLPEDMSLPDKRRYAKSVQDILKDDYKNLRENTRTTCMRLRTLLVKCVPELRTFGHWDFYNSVSLYTTLTDIFPRLKMDVSELVYNYSESKWNMRKFKTGTLDVRDYITDPIEPVDTDAEPESEEYSRRIQWNLIKSPILMLGHGSPIRRLDIIGDEKVVYRVGGGPTKTEDVRIHRKMGEYILDKEYRLFAITILHGVSFGREGGVHYTAIFRGQDENIYSYDDITGTSIRIDDWPHDIFSSRGSQKPNLFFYERVR